MAEEVYPAGRPAVKPEGPGGLSRGMRRLSAQSARTWWGWGGGPQEREVPRVGIWWLWLKAHRLRGTKLKQADSKFHIFYADLYVLGSGRAGEPRAAPGRLC